MSKLTRLRSEEECLTGCGDRLFALIPSAKRRLILLVASCAMGAVLGSSAHGLVSYSEGVIVICTLAIATGISSLWTP